MSVLRGCLLWWIVSGVGRGRVRGFGSGGWLIFCLAVMFIDRTDERSRADPNDGKC